LALAATTSGLAGVKLGSVRKPSSSDHDMALPLVHRMLHLADRPGGGTKWACPFCGHQLVAWPIYRRVTVKGQPDAVHVRGKKEIPMHLEDRVLEFTEADENWLRLNSIAWS
jgi:hypothetical protein